MNWKLEAKLLAGEFETRVELVQGQRDISRVSRSAVCRFSCRFSNSTYLYTLFDTTLG